MRSRSASARVVTGVVASVATLALTIATGAHAAVELPTAAVRPGGGDVGCDPFGAAVVDPSIPTAGSVLGIDLGDRDVTTAESDTYLQAVSAASPLVVDEVIGSSVQGRPLRYAVVGHPRWTSPAGLRRVQRDIAAIRDPATPPRRAARLIERTPAVLWVAGNVHGGEESGTDASLRVLYELAARTDCTAQTILDHAIVVILPVQNPDGREADTRRNAYGFDMNRDWFARTQPETDAKLEVMRQLPPQLFVDAHEMGAQGYFFPPNADPVYHEIGEQPLDWIYNLYGAANTAAFNRFGYDFFNGNIYDLFYMGYGDTVPTTGFNAAGMTYEKNNAEASDVRVAEQYTALWATLSAAGAKDGELLNEWREEFLVAQAQGRAGALEPNQLYYEGAAITNPVPDIDIRHYFLRANDPDKADEVQRLLRRLQRMDVEVNRLLRPLRVADYTAYGEPAADVTLPVGTYWIPLAQYQKHWIHAMLNEDTYVPFPYFYDVTAWSGPLLENVEGGRSGLELRPRATVVRGVPEPAPQPIPDAPAVAVWQVSPTAGASIESAGWLRWYLDNRLELPFTDVTGAGIAAGALADVDVLVVPNGSAATAAGALGTDGQAVLAQWVRGGGTLVTFRSANRLATTLGVTTATSVPATSDIPGSLVRVELDPSSPLAQGVGERAYMMYEYDDVWTATTPGTAAVSYPSAGDPDWFVSGFASGEEQLYGSAAVVDEPVGTGRVVLFASDPNYRAFTNGTAAILRNALAVAATPPAATAPAAAMTPPAVPVPGGIPAERSEDPAAGVVADDLVISVVPGAEAAVQRLLDGRGAGAEIVRGTGVVSFRVDLGGIAADDHAWAVSLADDAAALGDQVVAIRLP